MDDEHDLKPDGSGNYWTVKGLLRGLEVLRALNRQPAGSASASALSSLTGLHRTTVKRLLETLEEGGFVRHSAAARHYALTFRVRELSEGFQDDAWVCEVARPKLKALTEALLWPSDLVTLEGDELVVRDSTHAFSPLSFSSGVQGRRIPLLLTAVGRAYLAYCSDVERESLLDILRSRDDEEGGRARDSRHVRLLVEQTRARGYAINDYSERRHGSARGSERLGAIAVPIRRGQNVIACINIVFLLRAAKPEQIAERGLPLLLSTAREIEQAIA